MRTSLLLVLLGTTLLSCTRFVEAPRFEPREERTPGEAWGRVLETYVDEKGRVDFTSVARDPHDLYTYLHYVATVSPTSHPDRFPTKADKLEYYINSYNALAMYGIIAHGFPDDFHSFFDRARFFKLTEYRVGGKWISLYDYENDVIRPLDEPRVHFALNCMSVGCPRLPRKAFRARQLEQQLETAALEFFNSPRYVQLDPSKRVVRLSEILDFYPEDFVNERHAGSLIEYVNRYRRERIPKEFQVEFLSYHWAVAKQ